MTAQFNSKWSLGPVRAPISQILDALRKYLHYICTVISQNRGCPPQTVMTALAWTYPQYKPYYSMLLIHHCFHYSLQGPKFSNWIPNPNKFITFDNSREQLISSQQSIKARAKDWMNIPSYFVHIKEISIIE